MSSPQNGQMRVRHHFLICTNRRPTGDALPSCSPNGGEAVFTAFSQELARRGYPAGVKATATGCLTPCQHGPNVVVYPDGIWYCGVTPADVREIIAAHLDRETVVEHLLLPPSVRV
jgi:(2Fe-2S) ferredoxin